MDVTNISVDGRRIVKKDCRLQELPGLSRCNIRREVNFLWRAADHRGFLVAVVGGTRRTVPTLKRRRGSFGGSYGMSRDRHIAGLDIAQDREPRSLAPPCQSADRYAEAPPIDPREVISNSDHSKLKRLIEGRVLPQLLLEHSRGLIGPAADPAFEAGAGNERVGEFSDLVIRSNNDAAISYFKDMIADGSSVEGLFRDLLAPTARRLGVLWEEDINSILDVTQGLAHLQQLVHIFSPDFNDRTAASVSTKRALLMPMPGEQHTLGILLIEEYFRREGWHVWSGPPETLDELLALVGTMWFDMIGFSICRVSDAAAVKTKIDAVRKSCRNKNVTIMIGGRPFVDAPQLAIELGADATGADGPRALAAIAHIHNAAICGA